MGVPGSSSALAVARRFGMPATVIERAERFLTREDQNFEAVVKKLHDERAALELARAAAEEREREARRARTRLEGELRDGEKPREARAQRGGARADGSPAPRAGGSAGSAGEAPRRRRWSQRRCARRSARSNVWRGRWPSGGARAADDDARSRTPRESPCARRICGRERACGCQRLRAEAEVVEVLAGGQVRVAAGALKLTVSASELRAVARPRRLRHGPRSAR